MFIEPDEHIIIMEVGHNINIGPHYMLPDEYKQIADIGLKTVYHQAAIDWNKMQPTEGAEIDFSELDAYIETVTRAGLKALIPFFYHPPEWWPDDWFMIRSWPSIPNYANALVGGAIDAFAKKIIDRYPRGAMQLIYAIPADGEFPHEFWPSTSTLRFLTEYLTNFLVGRQMILSEQYGEIWTAYHHYTRPQWFEEVHDGLRDALPDSAFYSIQFTHFVHHRKAQRDALAWARDKWGIKYFAGSEYCQGLAGHTPLAIQEGIWGFITAPLYPGACPERLEPWMLTELERANKALQRSG